MRRLSGPEGLESPSSQTQRSQSLSSDRTSMSGPSSLVSPPTVDPEPAYIAASAASQIVTSDHQRKNQDELAETRGRFVAERTLVSPASLALLNAFLDQLLFNMLASSRSTSIAALRPAVSEVLKPRLAKDAIDGADEELQEFLGGGDDEELSAFHHGQEARGNQDINLIWRRTRLRCMVYTRLGDMEEEDEEEYIEREHLEGANDDRRRASRDLGLVSPAAAIFLTSILEFIGEHALIVAGEASYYRRGHWQLLNKRHSSGTNKVKRAVVEDVDMEKIAFNTTLGRLWRSWKKRVRSGSVTNLRPLSRDLTHMKAPSTSPPSTRTTSPSQIEGLKQHYDPPQRSSIADALQKEEDPALIPLPLSVSNAAEIESLSNSPATISLRKRIDGGIRERPHSMMLSPKTSDNSSALRSDTLTGTTHSQVKRLLPVQRRRSASLPTQQQPRSAYGIDETPSVAVTEGDVITPDHEVLHGQEHVAPLVRKSSLVSELSSDYPLTTSTIDGAPVSDISDVETSMDGKPRKSAEKPSNLAKDESDVSTDDYDLQTIPQAMNYSEGLAQTLSKAASSNYTPTPRESTHVRLKEDQLLRSANRNVRINPDDGYSSRMNAELASNEPSSLLDDELSQPKVGWGLADRATSQGQEIPKESLIESGRGPREAIGDHNKENHSHSISGGRDLRSEELLLSSREASPYPHETGKSVSRLAPSQDVMDASRTPSEEVVSRADTSWLGARGDTPPEDDLDDKNHLPLDAFSTSIFSQAKPASKLTDMWVQPRGSERAAVQRVGPSSPTSFRESLTPIGRDSITSNRDLRSVQTSGSGTSQTSHHMNGLHGRGSSEGGRQPVASRTSSDGGGSMISSKRSIRTPKPDDKQQSFEQLIKSDETIQYTLTPQSMRKMNIPESPRWVAQQGSEPGDLADPSRKPGLLNVEPIRPTTGRSIASLKGLNGLRSNPTSGPNLPKSRSPSATSFAGSQSQGQPPRSPASGRSGNVVARDARVEKETTRDFADFIRSTGPEGEAPSATSRPGTAVPTNVSQTNKVSKISSGLASAKISRANSKERIPVIAPTQDQDTVTKLQKPQLPKLQARDATVPKRGASSDLAAFIRQGPTQDRNMGISQMPSSVGPSRTTSRSGNRNLNLGPGTTKEVSNSRSSFASTRESSGPPKSINSANSRTGLLDTSERSNGKKGFVSAKPPRLDEPPHPKRRQRRVKDPYAIDSDSDSENGFKGTLKENGNEESLIDFLRSVTPPPPAVPAVPRSYDKATKNTVQRAAGATSMRDRFSRNPASTTLANNYPVLPGRSSSTRPSTTSPPSTSRSGGRSEAPQLPPLNPRETSPHLITQVGSKFDTYKPTTPTYAAHVDRGRNNGNVRTRQQPGAARSQREDDGGVADLAEFFKNSAPPPAPIRTRAPSVEKEASGFSRMFSRKKKGSGRI